MLVGVPKETFAGERRVAIAPASLPPLTKAGLDVLVERGAGAEAGVPDALYTERGATLARDRAALFRDAEVIVQVRALGANPDGAKADVDRMRRGQVLIGATDPLNHPETAHLAAEAGITSFSLELMPRITRAQSMDILSSMATVAGYKAVLIAADTLPKMFPMMMTAAGTIKPAKVFVIGAGVAGLQAIASARRMGAIIQAYDVRPAVKEQVESLGAAFVELAVAAEGAEDKGGYAKELGEEFYRRQRETMAAVVAQSDVVITTAAIPGRPAPRLVTTQMVDAMQPGSVIVDLAAERGGNCELTTVDEQVVTDNGVHIFGPSNLPATVPFHASQMFSRNVATYLLHLAKGGEFASDMEDEITRETLVTRDGEIVNARIRELLDLEPLPEPAATAPAPEGRDGSPGGAGNAGAQESN